MEHDLIEGVILLPENLFYNTSAAGIIVVLNKRKPKPRQGKIVLVNASKRFMKGRPKNYLPDDVPEAVAGLFNRGEAIDGEVAVITREQAEEADFNLSPSRWAGQADATEHRPVPELVAELERLDIEALTIGKALSKLLKGIPS